MFEKCLLNYSKVLNVFILNCTDWQSTLGPYHPLPDLFRAPAASGPRRDHGHLLPTQDSPGKGRPGQCSTIVHQPRGHHLPRELLQDLHQPHHHSREQYCGRWYLIRPCIAKVYSKTSVIWTQSFNHIDDLCPHVRRCGMWYGTLLTLCGLAENSANLEYFFHTHINFAWKKWFLLTGLRLKPHLNKLGVL